jgi:hypothetical protein
MRAIRQASIGKLRKLEKLPEVLDRRLLLYTLAAGAALAAVPASQAEVVFTSSSAVFKGLGKFDIDLDNDGSADFSIVRRWVYYDSSNMIQAMFAAGNRSSNQIAMRYGRAMALKKGTRIGTRHIFQNIAAMETAIYGGYWEFVKDRCLGVKFLINGEVH